MKIKAVWSFKISVEFYERTEGYIPEIVLFMVTDVRT
jgi:hypothetical protein